MIFLPEAGESSLKKAIELYEKSAMLGNGKAMMALGRIYEQGLCGIKPDLALAVQYYENAAAKNIPYALYWMGNIYENDQHPT